MLVLLSGCMNKTTIIYQTKEVCSKQDGFVVDVIEYEDIWYTLECYPVWWDQNIFVDKKPIWSKIVEKTLEDWRPTTGRMIVYKGEQYLHCK